MATIDAGETTAGGLFFLRAPTGKWCFLLRIHHWAPANIILLVFAYGRP